LLDIELLAVACSPVVFFSDIYITKNVDQYIKDKGLEPSPTIASTNHLNSMYSYGGHGKPNNTRNRMYLWRYNSQHMEGRKRKDNTSFFW